MGWYDAAYGDDPSTDNVFGREDLAERRNPLLQDYLRRGGALSAFGHLEAERLARERLAGTLDRLINAPHRPSLDCAIRQKGAAARSRRTAT